MRTRVSVTIDELRLYRFDPRVRRAIGDAIERELTERFQREPQVAAGQNIARVDAGSFTGNVAAGVADRVHAAVTKRC